MTTRSAIVVVAGALLVTTASFARASLGSADDVCSGGVFNRQGCAEAKHGSVTVEDAARRAGRGSPTPSGGHAPSTAAAQDAALRAAYCADATANAAAAGGAPQPIVDICAPLGPLPVAPGREQVLTAFRELPLYHGAIRTDPAVFTLVNLETYFWCGDADGRGCEAIGEAERQVTLLGQPVRIRPKILSYQWRFGDGTSQRADPGRTAHTYRRPGHVTVTLTLTWTADYALGTGSFQPIDDTTTTTSPSRVLPVREAQTVIVGDG